MRVHRKYKVLSSDDLNTIDLEARDRLRSDGQVELRCENITAHIACKNGVFTVLSVFERIHEYDVFQPILTTQLNYFMNY
ncbi:MAG: hypothetical protein SNH28_07505 [Rikenellaceae bacterium]